jgi:hypothetical protein
MASVDPDEIEARSSGEVRSSRKTLDAARLDSGAAHARSTASRAANRIAQ